MLASRVKLCLSLTQRRSSIVCGNTIAYIIICRNRRITCSSQDGNIMELIIPLQMSVLLWLCHRTIHAKVDPCYEILLI